MISDLWSVSCPKPFRNRCLRGPSELSGAIKSNWKSILHRCVPEVCIPLTNCRLWLEILPSGMSQRGTGHSLSLLNTSFTNFSESFCYLFWGTHTLFNSKDVKIEKKSRSVLFATTPPVENPMDGGAWWAAVHGVANSRTQLSDSLSLFTFIHWRRKWQPTPVFLPGESQGRGSLVDCRLWSRTASDVTEVT